jgi:hypothetical protein
MKLITFIQKQYQTWTQIHLYHMTLFYYYVLTWRYYANSYNHTELVKYRNVLMFPNIWIWLHNKYPIIIKLHFIDFWTALSHVPSHPQYPDSCMQHTHVEERWVIWQWPLGQRYSTLLGKVPVQQLLTKHSTEEVNVTTTVFQS